MREPEEGAEEQAPEAPRFTERDARWHEEYARQARDVAQQGRKLLQTPDARTALRRTITVAEWHESMAERIRAWIHFNG